MRKSKFNEENELEKAMAWDPRKISACYIEQHNDEWDIVLYQGANVLQRIPGWPIPHKTREAAIAHALRLGYRPM